jgi:hypothetical protein
MDAWMHQIIALERRLRWIDNAARARRADAGRASAPHRRAAEPAPRATAQPAEAHVARDIDRQPVPIR